MKIPRVSKKAALPGMIFVIMFLCVGLATVIPVGFMDFPCFVYYDEVNGCVVADDYFIEATKDERIQVLLTITNLHFMGGGCNSPRSSSNQIELETPVANLSIQQVENVLLVNGKELQPGDQFTYTKFWNPNPWSVYHLEFTYYGVVPICNGTYPAQAFVIGSYGDKVSLVKASLILLTSLFIIYLVRKALITRSKNGDNFA